MTRANDDAAESVSFGAPPRALTSLERAQETADMVIAFLEEIAPRKEIAAYRRRIADILEVLGNAETFETSAKLYREGLSDAGCFLRDRVAHSKALLTRVPGLRQRQADLRTRIDLALMALPKT